MHIKIGECILLQKWDEVEFVERHLPVFEKNKKILCSFDGMRYPIAEARIGSFDKIAITFFNSDKIHYICKIPISSIIRYGIPPKNKWDLIPEHYFEDGTLKPQKNWFLITDIKKVDLKLNLFGLCDPPGYPPALRPSHQYIQKNFS